MSDHYQFYRTTSEAWEAMFASILSAKESIYWEVYIFEVDQVGERFIKLLCAKAKEGVEVKLVADAIGSFSFSEAGQQKLAAAGVELLFYNRLHPEFKIMRWISRLWFRNHRKVLVVDESTVFLGGVNISARFRAWDDVYLKIQGSVARPLLRGFAKSYISAGGVRRNVRNLLHPKLVEWKGWQEKLRFIVNAPLDDKQSIKQVYLKALAAAKESVNFVTPYYAPDRQFLKAVMLARKRGVKVNIFLPLRTDVKLMELIARWYYRLTLKAGAEIYLLPNMHHGKAMSMDKTLGVVGSSNLTPRSLSINLESGVSFSDEGMVRDLNAMFNELKTRGKLIDMPEFEKRSFWERFKEWIASRIDRFV